MGRLSRAGANGGGTVFSIPVGGGTPKTLLQLSTAPTAKSRQFDAQRLNPVWDDSCLGGTRKCGRGSQHPRRRDSTPMVLHSFDGTERCISLRQFDARRLDPLYRMAV